jgi:hypothetical protein
MEMSVRIWSLLAVLIAGCLSACSGPEDPEGGTCCPAEVPELGSECETSCSECTYSGLVLGCRGGEWSLIDVTEPDGGGDLEDAASEPVDADQPREDASADRDGGDGDGSDAAADIEAVAKVGYLLAYRSSF